MSKHYIALLVPLVATSFQPAHATCPPDNCPVRDLFPSFEELTNIARQKALDQLAATSSSLSFKIIDSARSSIEDPSELSNFDLNRDIIHSQLESNIRGVWNTYLGSSFNMLLPTGLNAIGPRSPELFSSGSLTVTDFHFGTALSFDTPSASEVHNWSSSLTSGDVASVGSGLLGITHVNITGSVTTTAASFSGKISLDPVAKFPISIAKYNGSFDATYYFSLPHVPASGTVTWSAYGEADSRGAIGEWGSTLTACVRFSPEACTITTIPEPDSFALFLAGALLIGYGLRRNNLVESLKPAVF